MVITTLIVTGVIPAVVHLAGGACTHRRHRRAGLNPRLSYSLGRG